MNDEQAILDLHNRWLALELAGRAEDVVNLCSEDVCWLVPGIGTITGKKHIRSFLRQEDSVTLQDIEISGIKIEVSDSLAVKRAAFRTRVADCSKDAIFEYIGTHVWTLRRLTKDDVWLVTNVAWAIDEH